ncbi:ARHGH factor, partial [Polypterus senegalus]
MAQAEPPKKAALYRSVSFKKLESWSANKAQDAVPGGGAHSPQADTLHPPTAVAASSSSSSFSSSSSSSSRKVSKISAARRCSPPCIAPAIQQLRQRFTAPSGPPRMRRRRDSERGEEEEQEQREEAECSVPLRPDTATAAVPSACPSLPAVPKTQGGDSSSNSSAGDCAWTETSKWPSVTKMRKLFGDGQAPRSPKLHTGRQWHPLGQEEPSGALSPEPSADSWTKKPKPPPPPPPPRSSSVPYSLKYSRQPADSLHSSHSSSKPQAGVKGSSCEEEHWKGRGQGASAGGCKTRSPGRSSGSEEEEDGPCRDSGRRRALRKKKRSTVGSLENGESDDGENLPLMDPMEKRQGSADLDCTAAQDGEGQLPRCKVTRASELACSTGTLTKDKRPCTFPTPLTAGHYRGLSENRLSPSGSFLGSSRGSPIPGVSRVSKVSIPPFLSSPMGSRSSSRYSSTETLKEEEQVLSSSSVLSKSFHGNFTMFRSPSFSHADGYYRPQVRVRTKMPLGVKAKSEMSSEDSRFSAKSRHMMSASNPDIASETLTLLSFLKSDLSELRVKKKEAAAGAHGEGSVHYSSTYHHPVNHMPAYRTRGGLRSPGCTSPQNRPSLKELTATLRRTKSFTYSDKPAGRRLTGGSVMKVSTSELMLASTEDSDATVSDRDGEDGLVYDGLPYPLQDQYVQEARQVFKDISQIGVQDEGNFGVESREDECFRRNGETADVHLTQVMSDTDLTERTEGEKGLRNGDSEENVYSRRSVDELSGHDSSLTDEGIVTEPEMGPFCGPLTKDLLTQPLTVWKQANNDLQSEGRPALMPTRVLPSSAPVVKTKSESVTICGDVSYGQSTRHGPLEAPSTPSAIRRRRKFSSAGNNSSDSSNGSNGESSGEAYRSLSDPMPHRRCSIPEDTKNFSVDSNLLGSLNTKNGMPELSATDLSEFTGSAASDLSVCSDCLKDYNMVIQSIVREPGAMDKLNDEKGNGKMVKKKSFSDPSRRGESATAGFQSLSEPINEMDQAIPPSSSEPILSEQRDEVRELQELGKTDGKSRSRSEHLLPSHLESEAPELNPEFAFDPKLVEVLSPRVVRRSSKKRTNRVSHQESGKLQQVLEQPTLSLTKSRPTAKHIRHTSEPATFIPIASAEVPVPQSHPVSITVPEPSRGSQKPFHIVQSPSLEEESKKYMLALNVGDVQVPTMLDTSKSTPVTPTTGVPKMPRKPSEDLSPLPHKSKPQVGYMRPLKQPENSVICDPGLVDEMFYQIPEILEHHEQFLEQILTCVQEWHDKQKVGDLLIESFSKDILVNIYSAYIDNFLNAKDAVRIAKEAKPAFMKFLEQCMRENKEKQALSDLMIKPVQRIPRYELLVKDLLKHTPEDHPDHPFLIDAQKNIKQLAERINKGRKNAEEVERETRVLQEIEAHIEGMENLLTPQRKFLRQEIVVEVKAVGGKKDRSLFLFTDLLVCTTLKRKSGSLRRSSMSLYTVASVIDTSSKYKLLWKLPLEDMEMVKGTSQAANRENIQKTIGRLDEDLSTLGQISKLSETLSFPHQSLDDVIKDLMAAVHRELAEKQSLSFSMTFPPNKVELTTPSIEGTFVFEFSGPDTRSNFEQAFEDAKKKLALNKDHWDPEFLKAIPIMKTRSGMQFSCASPSHSCPDNMYEVWVCNSDGYVGQVCLLNIKNEPTVEACIAVCSARIICIAAVPGLKARDRGDAILCPPCTEPTAGSEQRLHISISGSSLELTNPSERTERELVPFDSDDTDDESSPSPSSTLQSQASQSTIASSFVEETASTKDTAAETTSSDEDQDYTAIPSSFGPSRLSSESPLDGRARRRSSRGSFTRGSLEDLLSIDPEAYQSSVWLGTEDGWYLDNKVFVSLANGDIIVYQREAGSFWDPQNSQTICLGTPGSPITKMVPVAGKLWCGCQNRVLVINTVTLSQEVRTLHSLLN